MSATVVLGPFKVSASRAEAEMFRAATGASDNPSSLPLTFPMRWLAAPDVRAALLGLVPEAEVVLVHESQAFAYTHSLRVGQVYDLALEARRVSAPDRLFVDGLIRCADGLEQARTETILRLIPAPGA